MSLVLKNNNLPSQKIEDFQLIFKKERVKNISCEIKKNTKFILLNNESYRDFYRELCEKRKSKNQFKKNNGRNLSILPHLNSESYFPQLRITHSLILNSFSNGSEKIFQSEKILNYNEKPKKIFPYLRNSFKNKLIKDNALIITESILKNQNDNDNLECGEKLIFSKMNHSLKEHYKEFIIEKINILKQNLNKNFTYLLTKEYNEKDNNFILKLKSLQIIFENIQTKKIKKLYFPFSYLPIFYYKDFQYFRFILLSLIKFSKDFEKISYDEKKMIQFLKNSILFKQKSRISDLTSIIQSNIFLSDKNEKEINQKGNLYIFLWNTPKYTFKVKIKIPRVQTVFLSSNQIIEYQMNSDFMCFLLEKNFSNWGFYIIKFFVSFKLFRKCYEHNLSKNKYNNYLSHFSYISKREKLRIVPLKIIDFIDIENKKKFFLYFETNNDLKSKISIIHGLKFEISHFEKLFNIDFSFNEMKILSIISKYENIKHFILKILFEDKNNLLVRIDNKFFSLFKENEFKDIYPKITKEGENNKKNYIRGFSGILKTSHTDHSETIKDENHLEKQLNLETISKNENSHLNLATKINSSEIEIEEQNEKNKNMKQFNFTIHKRKTLSTLFLNSIKKQSIQRRLTQKFSRENSFPRTSLKSITFHNENNQISFQSYLSHKKVLELNKKIDQFHDLKEESLFIYNPYIENFKIKNDNIDSNISRNVKHEIKIEDFKTLIDIPKYSIPKFLNDNPHFIQKDNKIESFGDNQSIIDTPKSYLNKRKINGSIISNSSQNESRKFILKTHN